MELVETEDSMIAIRKREKRNCKIAWILSTIVGVIFSICFIAGMIMYKVNGTTYEITQAGSYMLYIAGTIGGTALVVLVCILIWSSAYKCGMCV